MFYMISIGKYKKDFEYIPWNMHTFLFYCDYIIVLSILILLPIFFRVASHALGQSYDCHSACEASLKDLGKNQSV